MSTAYELTMPHDLLGLVRFFDRVLPRPWYEQAGIPGLKAMYEDEGDEECLLIGLKAEHETNVLLLVRIPRHTRDITWVAYQIVERDTWELELLATRWTIPEIQGQMDIAEAVLALAWKEKNGFQQSVHVTWEMVTVSRCRVKPRLNGRIFDLNFPVVLST